MIARLFRVVMAAFLGLLAAAVVFAVLGLEHMTNAVHGRDFIDLIATALGWFDSAAKLLAVASLAPLLLVVVVGEVGRIRSALFYILGSGAALAVIPLVAAAGPSAPLAAGPPLWTIFATAGFACGGVYWLIAGRAL